MKNNPLPGRVHGRVGNKLLEHSLQIGRPDRVFHHARLDPREIEELIAEAGDLVDVVPDRLKEFFLALGDRSGLLLGQQIIGRVHRLQRQPDLVRYMMHHLRAGGVCFPQPVAHAVEGGRELSQVASRRHAHPGERPSSHFVCCPHEGSERLRDRPGQKQGDGDGGQHGPHGQQQRDLARAPGRFFRLDHGCIQDPLFDLHKLLDVAIHLVEAVHHRPAQSRLRIRADGEVGAHRQAIPGMAPRRAADQTPEVAVDIQPPECVKCGAGHPALLAKQREIRGVSGGHEFLCVTFLVIQGGTKLLGEIHRAHIADHRGARDHRDADELVQDIGIRSRQQRNDHPETQKKFPVQRYPHGPVPSMTATATTWESECERESIRRDPASSSRRSP